MLTGRELETQQIAGLVNGPSVAAGSLRVIQLSGAIGMGKSALLSAVLPLVDGEVFVARGDRVLESGPLSSHRAMIESLLGVDIETLVADESPRSLALRCAAAFRSPRTAVAVDDAQWLDDASQEFLIGLVDARFDTDLTLLFVHRTGQEPSEIVTHARRRGAQLDSFVLSALDDSIIQELLVGLTPAQVATVVRIAQGNPLFARTALAAFRRYPEARRARDVLRLDDGTPSAILSAAVADDVNSLPADARRVVETLALLGLGSTESISIVSGLPPEQCEAGVEVLRQRGLLSSNPHEPMHPVVRFSVYQNTDLEWRARAHQAVAALPETDLFDRAEHLGRVGSRLTSDEAAVLVQASSLAIGSDPRAALRWLRGIPVQHLTVRSETLLARAEILDGRVNDALQRLHPLAIDAPSNAEVRVLLANALRMSNQPEEARAMLARELETDGVSANLLREMIDIIALLDGESPDDLLHRLASMPGEENGIAASIYRTMGLLSAGNVAEARQTFRRATTWLLQASAEGLRELLHAAACAVWCAYMLESFETGSSIAARALGVARRFGQADVLSNLSAGLSFCLAQRGGLNEADEAAEQAIAYAKRYGPSGIFGMARASLMISAFAHRDAGLMAERFDALRRTDLPTFGWWRRAVLGIRIRAAAIVGEPEPYTPLLGMPRDAMSGLHFADAALVAAQQGDTERAIDLAHEGLSVARQMGLIGQVGQLQATLAEILLRDEGADQARRARELFVEARNAFERLGMGVQLERVGAGIARADSITAQSLDPLAVLTPREQEVAILIAQGHTNREIAAQLVISPRTAEEHAAKVMRKLGAPSRAAIGALLFHQPR